MKKFKRYDEGGDVSESRAKQRGLELSNKEEPVGFFERIRMGNIDQPGSEAYNRFGAGRGYAQTMEEESEAARAPMRAPAAAPAPSARPMSDDMYSDYGSSSGSGAAGTSETIKPTRQVMTKPTLPASKPTAPAAAAVPSLRNTGPMRGDLANKPATTANYSNEGRSRPAPVAPAKPSMDVPGMRESAKTALADDPTALIGGAGAAAAALLARSKLGKMFRGAKKAADKSPYLKEIGMEPKKLTGSKRTDSESQKADKAYDKLKNSKFTKKGDDDVTDVTAKKRGGMVKKYASGGMVSSASKRADGIATKGKTRCKIC
jgi:gas vesicle protein